MHRSQVARSFPLKLPIRHRSRRPPALPLSGSLRASAGPHPWGPRATLALRTIWENLAATGTSASASCGSRPRRERAAGRSGRPLATREEACCIAWLRRRQIPARGSGGLPYLDGFGTTAHASGSVAVACRLAAEAVRCFDCSAREYQRCRRCWVMSSSVAARGCSRSARVPRAWSDQFGRGTGAPCPCGVGVHGA